MICIRQRALWPFNRLKNGNHFLVWAQFWILTRTHKLHAFLRDLDDVKLKWDRLIFGIQNLLVFKRERGSDLSKGQKLKLSPSKRESDRHPKGGSWRKAVVPVKTHKKATQTFQILLMKLQSCEPKQWRTDTIKKSTFKTKTLFCKLGIDKRWA